MCEQCSKWNHTECEIKAGNTDLIELKEEAIYFCVTCRKTKKNPKMKEGSPSRNQDHSFLAQLKDESTTGSKD